MRLIIILFCFLPSLLFSQDLILDTIQHDGIDRDFILNVPTHYDGTKPMALIFNFHGFGSNSTQQMFYGDFRSIAEEEGVILVQPQGTLFGNQAHWNVGGWTNGSTVDDVGFVKTLLEYLVENYNIDETRVYATGMSNGGYMSYQLACQLNDKFAAIASVTGSMTPEIFNNCNPDRPTPVMQIHGTDDLVVPYDGADFSYSIDEVMAYWIEHNNCNPNSFEVEIEDINSMDGTTATYFQYSECDNNITTELFRINGGGHTWPGSVFGGAGTNLDINGTQEIWKFFSKYDINGLLPSSISNVPNLTSVNIFPNPANESINIESTIVQDGKLYNLLGKELKSIKLNEGITSLDLSLYDNGVYFLKTTNSSTRFVLSK